MARTTNMNFVKINTKSNYKDLNGQVFQVVEVMDTRVSISVYDDSVQRNVIIDFGISEVEFVNPQIT
jgi:hypothetical protein